MNDSIAIKERFEKSEPGYASRISPDHILDLYIGADEQGRKMIEFRGKFRPRTIKSTSAIDVSQYKGSQYNILRFTLLDEEISGLFYIFCNDLAEQTSNVADASNGYSAVTTRFYQWKQMFFSSKKKKLTEPEIMGLIGELLFLRDGLSKEIGIHDALHSWSGQELTRKDFSFNDTWYEVKAVSRGKPTVRISSLEQLDSANEGQLVVFPMEKMSEEYHGVTLNKLVINIRDHISDPDDKELFLNKVAMQGYEYSNYYDEFVYAVDTMQRYQVRVGFPRLMRSQIPTSITHCTYELLLRDLEMFAIGEK